MASVTQIPNKVGQILTHIDERLLNRIVLYHHKFTAGWYLQILNCCLMNRNASHILWTPEVYTCIGHQAGGDRYKDKKIDIHSEFRKYSDPFIT